MNTKVSYYPGCSLRGTGREYGESAEAVFKSLGTELVELPDWSCCGASSAHSENKGLAVEIAARNLILAKESGLKDMVIPCSACFQRTKVAEYELKENPQAYPDISYNSEVNIPDIVSFVHNKIGIEAIKKNVIKKLTGLKVVSYYGCLISRHPKITGAGNFENPTEMDTILEALGTEVIDWGYKTDCCGGSLAISQAEIMQKLVGNLYDKALEAGAECIAVCCPLCHANLDMYQKEISKRFKKNYNTPIFYFTELIGLAIGEKDIIKWLKRHLTDPIKLLKEKNLL
ncbi:MAG: CoB--CoM heterodisulfide reductase iron-sulfur subunit B family protein [Spirochaetes bacterium]|nr:CoB--CoM heterodisulfide reductase iron-sulfur subunit B family protein [Spirochaetota bacterium]